MPLVLLKNTDWYNDLDANRTTKMQHTTIKSLLENAIKELNYLEDKIMSTKIKSEIKLTARQVLMILLLFLKNKTKSKEK
jgi:hypothetical protein